MAVMSGEDIRGHGCLQANRKMEWEVRAFLVHGGESAEGHRQRRIRRGSQQDLLQFGHLVDKFQVAAASHNLHLCFLQRRLFLLWAEFQCKESEWGSLP